MATVYVLRSKSANSFYTGSCYELEDRLKDHKSKRFASSFTSNHDLYYYHGELDYETAREIESHIKRMKSRRYILNLKKYPEIMRKLILKYSKLG